MNLPISPLLLLHGSAETAACWDGILAQIDGTIPITRSNDLVSVDAVHSHGPSLTPGTHVIGHSYGGLLALELALRHPERVGHLSLIEPVLFGLLIGRDEEALAPVLETSKAFDCFDRGEQEPALRALLDYWFGPGTWERAPQPLRTLMFADADLIRDQIRHAASYRVGVEELQQLDVPTTLVSADRSRASARSIVRILEQLLPRAHRVEIAGARHDLIRSHPRDVATALGLPLAPQVS